MKAFELVIVIPCYNEQERLPIQAFEVFLKEHPHVGILFVNDASTDDTFSVLETLKQLASNQIEIVSNKVNLGKAESVRNGILSSFGRFDSRALAYLDADLATSLSECHSLTSYLTTEKEFVFASRILKIGSIVERKFSRFLLGRIIATAISNILEIKVYDTQCGCKVFTADIAKIAFDKPFLSKWLFDVEVFSRILCHYRQPAALALMEEIPVKKWIDQGDSKVKLSYAFRLWYDLYLIRRIHRKNYRAHQ